MIVPPTWTASGLEEYVALTRDRGIDPRAVDVEVRNAFTGLPVAPSSKRFRRGAHFDAGPSRVRAWFLVLCEGRAGSRWLASSLHLHPEIVCSVGIDHPCHSVRFYHNEEEQRAILRHSAARGTIAVAMENVERVSPAVLEREGLRATLTARDRDRNALRVFDELEELLGDGVLGPKRAIGNVHGVQAYQLASCLDTYSDPFSGRQPVVAQLVRHPVSRFESRVSAHVRFFEAGLLSDPERALVAACCDEHAAELRAIEREFQVDFGLVRNQLFFYLARGCEYQRAWATELVAYDVEHIPFERLRSDRDYYAWVVSYLTQNLARVDDDYLDAVFSPGNLAQSRGTGMTPHEPSPPGPREQFGCWSDWERDVFRSEIRRYDLQNVYARVGYDLSFAL